MIRRRKQFLHLNTADGAFDWEAHRRVVHNGGTEQNPLSLTMEQQLEINRILKEIEMSAWDEFEYAFQHEYPEMIRTYKEKGYPILDDEKQKALLMKALSQHPMFAKVFGR